MANRNELSNYYDFSYKIDTPKFSTSLYCPKINIRDPHFIIPILETLNKSYDFVRVLYTNVFFTGVKIYTLVLF